MTDNTNIRTISEAVVRKHLRALLTEMEDPSVRYKAAWGKYKEDLGYNEFNYAFAHFLDHDGTGVEFLKKLYDTFFNAFDTIRENRKTDSLLKYATPATLCFYLFNNPVEADLLYYIQNKKINPMGIPENVLIAFLNYMKRRYFQTAHHFPGGRNPYRKDTKPVRNTQHKQTKLNEWFVEDRTDRALAKQWNETLKRLGWDSMIPAFLSFLHQKYPQLERRIINYARRSFEMDGELPGYNNPPLKAPYNDTYWQMFCAPDDWEPHYENPLTFDEFWACLTAGKPWPKGHKWTFAGINADFVEYITPVCVYLASDRTYAYYKGERTRCGIPNRIYHEFLDSLNA